MGEPANSYTLLVNIRRIREHKKISQQHMADFLGLERSGYTKIENGTNKINSEYVERIAEKLGVPVAELYGGNTEGSGALSVLERSSETDQVIERIVHRLLAGEKIETDDLILLAKRGLITKNGEPFSEKDINKTEFFFNEMIN